MWLIDIPLPLDSEQVGNLVSRGATSPVGVPKPSKTRVSAFATFPGFFTGPVRLGRLRHESRTAPDSAPAHIRRSGLVRSQTAARTISFWFCDLRPKGLRDVLWGDSREGWTDVPGKRCPCIALLSEPIPKFSLPVAVP